MRGSSGLALTSVDVRARRLRSHPPKPPDQLLQAFPGMAHQATDDFDGDWTPLALLCYFLIRQPLNADFLCFRAKSFQAIVSSLHADINGLS